MEELLFWNKAVLISVCSSDHILQVLLRNIKSKLLDSPSKAFYAYESWFLRIEERKNVIYVLSAVVS